jgi:hypothetical protein
MLAVIDILSRLDDLLVDSDRARWTVAERLRWIQDAEREISALPGANTETVELALQPGNVRQPLPAGVLRLVDVRRNLSSGRSEPVTATTLASMDAWRPDWQRDTTRATIQHFIVDARDPRGFWVWPKPMDAVRVEAVVVRDPPLPVPEGVLPLDSGLMSAIVDFVAHRAFSKDGPDTFDATRAMAYRQAFAADIGVAAQADAAAQPIPGAA